MRSEPIASWKCSSDGIPGHEQKGKMSDGPHDAENSLVPFDENCGDFVSGITLRVGLCLEVIPTRRKLIRSLAGHVDSSRKTRFGSAKFCTKSLRPGDTDAAQVPWYVRSPAI